MRSKNGFTLVEILVVMAISVILVGLVLGPVIQSFKMTRQAEAMINAQDAARTGMEQISRELGQAMFVFDNSVSNIPIYNDGTTPSFAYRDGAQGPIQLPVRQVGGDIQCFTLPNGKIDLVLPRITMHCDNPNHPEGEPRDYPRGNEAWPPCPACEANGRTSDIVSARPKMPLEQDVTIVRYFLGLRYNNPNYMTGSTPPSGEGIFGWRSPWEGQVMPGDENQVVLYRVEFNPYDDTLFPADMPVMERIADPIFFYRTAPNVNGDPCCQRWMEIARIVGIGKYQDLVKGTFEQSGNCTAVEPTVTFKFRALNNDTFTGAYSSDRASEYPNAVPSIYLASYGYWIDNHLPDTNYSVDIFRDNNSVSYSTEVDPATGHLLVRRRDAAGELGAAYDITNYLTSNTIPQDTEMLFTIDLDRGRVNFALTPPRAGGSHSGPACLLDPGLVNAAFHSAYQLDKGGARRMATLDHFNPDKSVYLPFARIVAGSDSVVGPDATPGPNYGRYIRYERVPLALGDPGPNQYKIDYDTGLIYFTSIFNQDIPEIQGPGSYNPIRVDYKIQFNRDGDVIKGDYTTMSLVTVDMGMRMFDPDSGDLHAVDLTNSIKVRNAHR